MIKINLIHISVQIDVRDDEGPSSYKQFTKYGILNKILEIQTKETISNFIIYIKIYRNFWYILKSVLMQVCMCMSYSERFHLSFQSH